MRKHLFLSAALVAVLGSEAAAQTCTGMPAFASGPVQVSGLGAFADGTNSFGGAIGYGRPASLFAKAGVASTSVDGLDGSEIGVGATVGYQLAVGTKQQFEVCPVATAQYGFGRNDVFEADDKLSTRGLTAGVAVGTALGTNEKLRIVPNAALAFAYAQNKYESSLGDGDVSESFALATLGLGFVFNSSFGLAPTVSFPIGLDNGDASFGLTGSVHFGR